MTAQTRKATLYRMVMDEHICPFGLKSRDLLKSEGYAVDDHWLTTRKETDDFQAEQNVDTTPHFTSRKVVFPLLEQLGLDCVPVLHCLQGRPTCPRLIAGVVGCRAKHSGAA